MAQSQQPKLVDPFHGQSILSLHPRTFRDSKVSLKSTDFEAIHQYMASLALQNPGKHFEEAQSIIDGGSKFFNTKENFEPITKENEDPRKNRPALARKRAKFSMKPDISQPSTVTEPTFEIDKLHDPEDFFAAYEKFENATKELKRQRGEDQNEPKKSTTARQRRPEIARRKTSYQHHVYSSQPEIDTAVSQESLQDTVESQPIHNSQRESVTPNGQSKEIEGTAKIIMAEDRVNKLFDDIMSSDITDLDGNEALSYLKDRLNIKPVSIPDLQLNIHDIPRVDLLSSVNSIEGLDILPDTRPFSDNLKGNTLGKQKRLSDKPLNSLSSPTSPSSPFLAISTFSKLLSKSTESDDRFSARGVDLFPNTTTCEVISGPSPGASKDKEFVESASKDNLSEVLIGKEHHELHSMEEVDEDIQGSAEDMVDKAASPTPTKLYLNVAENITDNLHCENEIGENIKDTTEKVVPSSPQENVEITMEELESNRLSAQKDDNSINAPAATLDQNPDMVSEQQNEEPLETVNNRKNSRARKVDPRKKRHSLAGGGSSWAGGVRRSNRIKTKPLEYWNGERLLYARIHNSLPTVIGVKYMSPSTTSLKVKSFVADKYKDLVELASLH